MSWPLKCLIGFSIALALVWGGAVVCQQWIDSRRIIAGPQNQSAFYRGYDPEEVVERFRNPYEGYGRLSDSSAVQDTEFVKHSKGFEPQFTIESYRKAELVNAIDQQIRSELEVTGTHVIYRFEEPSGNFGYKYATPNGGGSIVVHLPEPYAVTRNMPLPSNLEDISLKIDLEETWNRPTSCN